MQQNLNPLAANIKNAKICLFGDATNIHFRRWAMSLKDLGYNISVISYRKAELSNIEVHDISCSEMRKQPKCEKYVRFLRGIKMLFTLRSTLKKIKPDIVHVHYLINTPLVFGFWGLRKLIVSPWGNDIIYDRGREPLLVIFYKKVLLRWAMEITATTKFLGKHIQKYLNCKPVIIPFGVDTSKFDGLRKTNRKKFVITFIKHLEEKYGPRFLIEAVPLITDVYTNITVYIVGTGRQKEYLKSLVNRMGLRSYVQFLGRFSHEQVIEILRETDIFVMPSVYESEVFGVAAIEASAMGVSVVASNLAGIREAVVDGKTGILVAPGDAKAIADVCIRLIKDGSLRTTMGENGKRFVKDNYEWQNCLDKMTNVYKKFRIS